MESSKGDRKETEMVKYTAYEAEREIVRDWIEGLGSEGYGSVLVSLKRDRSGLIEAVAMDLEVEDLAVEDELEAYGL